MTQLKLPSSKEDFAKFSHKKDMKGNILKMLLYCRLPTVTYNSNLADLIVLWKSGEFGTLLLQLFLIQQSSSFLV
jgi:hypothetical protein